MSEATAWHEAGHAVAQFFLRTMPGVRRVTIVPTKDLLGHMAGQYSPAFRKRQRAGDWGPHTEVRHYEEIIMLLAGGIAERRATGRASHVGARLDYEHAADFALAASGNDAMANALLRWLRLRAEALLEMHWEDVKAVAVALMQENTLNSSRLREVILGSHTAIEGSIDGERRGPGRANGC